ncbi:MAG: glycosyltransferase family 39 protein [Candidatus Coatesbacteria bacterium]|nr:glycosyltransferase family 39 protein [Candidatus Coatesbacteria bacterium]
MAGLQKSPGAASSAPTSSAPGSLLPIVLITLLAAALRLYHLGHLSFWYDEAVTLILSKDVSALPQSLTTCAPLPLVLAHYWDLVSLTEFWGRLWVAAFGIALVPVVWALGRRLLSERAGLFAAVLVAVNPLCVYYSQEARAYSILPFFVVASGCCWLIAAQRRKWWPYGFCASLALALAFYSHYYAVLWVVSLPLSVLLMARSRRQAASAIKLDLETLVASLVFVAPWLTVFLDKATTTLSTADFWIPKPTLKTLVLSLKNMSVGFQAPLWAGAIAAILIAIVVILGLGCGLARGRSAEMLFLAANALIPILLAFAISRLAKNSVYLDRCLIPSSIFLLMIAAYGMSILRKWTAIVVLALFFSLTSLSLYNHYKNVIPDISHCPGVRPRGEFKQAADFVRQNLVGGDLVAHTCRSSLAPFMVYLPEGQRQVVLASSSEHRAKVMQKYPYKGLWTSELSRMTLPIPVYELPPGFRRLILVASEWDIGQTDFYSQEKVAIKRLLDDTYPLVMSKDFYGAPLYFYDLTTPLAGQSGTGQSQSP